jgi:prevent-host-death family protein
VTGKESHEVGVFDAKSRLSELLERVEHGEVIVITRHGAPIARLVPYANPEDRELVREAVEGLLAWKGPKLPSGVSLRQLIREGRA